VTTEHNNWLLSGGIGSGKSEVRRLLADHGLFTIDADSVGHRVLAPGGPASESVSALWPEVVKDGLIDRRALGSIVFENRDELHKLEAITHPLIFDEISRMVLDAESTVIVEIPVLRQPFDDPWRRIVVDAPDDIRLERANARGMSRADVSERMNSQPSRQEWLAAADLVMPNSGSLDELRNQVSQVLPALIS
jgi:dephospho-CoA kinase